MYSSRFAAGISFIALLTACELDPERFSENVSSRDLTLDIDGFDEGAGAAISVRVSSIIGDLYLTGGDTLGVLMGETKLELRMEGDETGILYRAEVPQLVDDLTIDLKRLHYRSASVIARVLPPFSLTSTGIAEAEPIVFTWEKAEGDHAITLLLEGSCIKPLQRGLAQDTGEYSISPAEIFPVSDAPCPLTASLTRTLWTQGALFQDVDGGDFLATMTQRRTITVSAVP